MSANRKQQKQRNSPCILTMWKYDKRKCTIRTQPASCLNNTDVHGNAEKISSQGLHNGPDQETATCKNHSNKKTLAKQGAAIHA
jgi:hypothetical protein